MSALHVARIGGWVLGCVLAAAILGAMLGPRWVALGALIGVVATVWLVLWLPRSAHAAFLDGRFRRAGRRYRILASLAFSPRRERAAILSHAGCDIADGDPRRRERASDVLASLDPSALELTERVVWLNNRACAELDREGDAGAALSLAEEAIGLRPDVPALHHTRARALVTLGRLDDAISVLDAMRAGGELAPRLEAERCRELARAWERKGHVAYAEDYRERARLVAR